MSQPPGWKGSVLFGRDFDSKSNPFGTTSIPHALHTSRINLSPFTKDFRVWGAQNEMSQVFVWTWLRSAKSYHDTMYLNSKRQSIGHMLPIQVSKRLGVPWLWSSIIEYCRHTLTFTTCSIVSETTKLTLAWFTSLRGVYPPSTQHLVGNIWEGWW